jgi:hypothetical protein
MYVCPLEKGKISTILKTQIYTYMMFWKFISAYLF